MQVLTPSASVPYPTRMQTFKVPLQTCHHQLRAEHPALQSVTAQRLRKRSQRQHNVLLHRYRGPSWDHPSGVGALHLNCLYGTSVGSILHTTHLLRTRKPGSVASGLASDCTNFNGMLSKHIVL